MIRSSFWPATLLKSDSNAYVFLWILANTSFEEPLRTAASEETLGSDCLRLSFWRVSLKTIQAYRNTSHFQTRVLFKFNPWALFWTQVSFMTEKQTLVVPGLLVAFAWNALQLPVFFVLWLCQPYPEYRVIWSNKLCYRLSNS